MRLTGLVSVMAAVGLLVAGCDQRATPGTLVLDDGGGALTVAVDPSTGATTPTYSWDGADARELTVTRADGTAVVWRLEAADPGVGFPAPVRHGVVPEEARETTTGDLLRTGVDYRVRIVAVDGASGSRVFRP